MSGAEVDPDLEITEIKDRVVKSGGPALLFENVKGSSHLLICRRRRGNNGNARRSFRFAGAFAYRRMRLNDALRANAGEPVRALLRVDKLGSLVRAQYRPF